MFYLLEMGCRYTCFHTQVFTWNISLSGPRSPFSAGLAALPPCKWHEGCGVRTDHFNCDSQIPPIQICTTSLK